MSPEISLLRDSWTAGDAIARLRMEARPEEASEFFVVDGANRLRGLVTAARLLLARPTDRIEQIMRSDIVAIRAGAPASDVTKQLRHYNLSSVPVIDENGVPIGAISAQQGIKAQAEQDTQDMFMLAGLDTDESVRQSAVAAFPTRLFWLTVNLATVLLAAATIGLFESTIAQAAALATFMPIVAGMGGNSATQIVTLVVRSLSMREAATSDVMGILRKETLLAAANALVLGGGVGLAAWIWKGNEWLGLVVAVAVSFNLVLAGVTGVLIPVGIKLLRSDPALSSAIVVTTFTDVLGFLVLLGLATILLNRLV
jgi:magnesium transporter